MLSYEHLFIAEKFVNFGYYFGGSSFLGFGVVVYPIMKKFLIFRQSLPFVVSLVFAFVLYLIADAQIPTITPSLSLKSELYLDPEKDDSFLLLSVKDMQDSTLIKQLKTFQNSTVPFELNLSIVAEDGSILPYKIMPRVPLTLNRQASYNIFYKIPTKFLKEHRALTAQLQIANLYTRKIKILVKNAKKPSTDFSVAYNFK